MAKRRRRKRWIGKIAFTLILIGTVGLLVFLYLYKEERGRNLRPELGKRDLSRGTREVVLYFSDQDGEFLIGERRRIARKEDPAEEGKELIHELILGPKGRLLPTLPPQTRCLGLKLNEKGLARINFDRTLSKDHPGGSSAEILTAYSIVHSLTQNYPQIKEVQILIEGKPAETLAGHLSLKQPLSTKPDLMRKQP